MFLSNMQLHFALTGLFLLSQMTMNVTRSRAATAEAAASTQREHTSASVALAINTWCCMDD